MFDDFGGRVPSDKPPIKTPGELAIERGEPWPQAGAGARVQGGDRRRPVRGRRRGAQRHNERRQRLERRQRRSGQRADAARLRRARRLARARLAAAQARQQPPPQPPQGYWYPPPPAGLAAPPPQPHPGYPPYQPYPQPGQHAPARRRTRAGRSEDPGHDGGKSSRPDPPAHG